MVVGAIPFPERISLVGTGFGHAPMIRKLFEFSTFSRFSALFDSFRLASSGFVRVRVLLKESNARGLYESSRAVTQVDGLPRAPSGDNYM